MNRLPRLALRVACWCSLPASIWCAGRALYLHIQTEWIPAIYFILLAMFCTKCNRNGGAQ